MKKFLVIMISLLFCEANAQKDYKKITAKELATIVTISDLVKDLPADCNLKSYELSFTTPNGLKSFSQLKDTIAPILKQFIPNPKKGQKIFVTMSQNSCKTSQPKEYKFIINED